MLMPIRYLLVFLLTLFPLWGATPPNRPLVSIEKNGKVVVEAENFALQEKTEKRSWVKISVGAPVDIQPDGDPSHAETASANAYLEALPDTRRTHDDQLVQGENFTNKGGHMAVLTYPIHFSSPGRYYCWVRTFSTNTEDNGIHLGLNGSWPASGARMQWTAKNKWAWDTKQRTAKVHTGVFGKIYLDIPTAGTHFVHFSMREDGFEFDQFVLTKEKPNAEKPPSGALPASEQRLLEMPVLATPAEAFSLEGGFYLDQEKRAGINPDQRKKARTSFTFPHAAGRYDLILQAVGENDGQATHQVAVNDSVVLKHQVPLAEKQFDSSPRFHAQASAIEIEPGDVVSIDSQVHSVDGKEWSRARLVGVAFLPADVATALAVRLSEQKTPVPKTQVMDRAAPSLQQPRQPDGDGKIRVSAKPLQWQPVRFTLSGRYAHELDVSPNPFLDYSFHAVFTHQASGQRLTRPGFFAADGESAESSAQSGTQWCVLASFDQPGSYQAEFFWAEGKGIALDLGAKGKKLATLDFEVSPAPADASGFYQKGRLNYVGQRLLQFSGNGEYFIKAGADAPETLLAYADFDGTEARKPKVPLKTWQPHVQDWQKGDPTWQGQKGKGLIGAINYLSDQGMNAFSFLPYNAGGDGDNVWPFVSRDQKFHYDCSKLAQWDIVFQHAQKRGLFLHFKLQETENDDINRGHSPSKPNYKNVPTALDKGDTGPERKLYLRELVARFGHHLALNWNLGEENTQTTKQQTDMAEYLSALDTYKHHLVIHTFPQFQDAVYRPLLGHASFSGASVQNSHLKDCHWMTVKWIRESRKADRPWAVAFDEPGSASIGVPPDPDYPGMPKDYKGPTIDQTRRQVLWGTLMGGGFGVEYYFGYKLPENDLVCEDWRSRERSWRFAKVALDFFARTDIPHWTLMPQDELIGNPKHENFAYCLASDTLALIYLEGTRPVTMDKSGFSAVEWFNPRNGESTEPEPIDPAAKATLTPPTKNDWLAILRR